MFQKKQQSRDDYGGRAVIPGSEGSWFDPRSRTEVPLSNTLNLVAPDVLSVSECE